jgi:acyl-CoA synthetase (AMP-forming)/AMP-acid ligase II
MDRDDVVTFAGVRKAMFTRNGFNVYPREIELAVLELDGVRRAVVEPVPSAPHDNDIRLTIDGDATDAAIMAWCEQRLSAYKQPTEIVRGGAGLS